MEQNSTERVALIDFDSIFYTVGHIHRDTDPTAIADVYAVKQAVDSKLNEIMTMTQSNRYVIAVSDTKEVDYRKMLYKYNEYKGGRIEPEFIKKWKSIITCHIVKEWKIVSARGYEADDIVATAASMLREQGIDYVVCSPDKDLLQVQGKHWNYSKAETQEMRVIDFETANYTKWIQVLTGDSTDNVAGIPGLGPTKAPLILKDVHRVEYKYKVEQAYIKYYGPHYGPIIMEETIQAIVMNTACTHVIPIQEYTPKHEREVF